MRMSLVLSTLAGAVVSTSALAAPVLINFDPPSLPQGPSTFAAAGPAQTIVLSPATFTGGVILGFPTSFPAIPFASAPNLYGTASFGDASLQRSLVMDIDSSYACNLVEGVLFNGNFQSANFSVQAFDGASLVASQSFNLANNSSGGNAVFSLSAANITKVVVTDVTTSTGSWDFFIDTIVLNDRIPAPGAAGLLGLGLIAAGRRRR
jgi:hypothetical protein